MRKPNANMYVPIDLAAVCSVAFILLLLYLSMARFELQDPVTINLPETSGYECTLSPIGDAIITIGQGKIFLTIPPAIRRNVLLKLGSKHHITFTPGQINQFQGIRFIGMSLADFGSENLTNNNKGINISNNELADWIHFADREYHRNFERRMQFAIKADKTTLYPEIKRIMTALRNQKINRISFIIATKFTDND
ncbi:hypothetical protein ACFQZX_15820 [Mucilaginibacter litoreus]|uniref:Biopolymer transport protein ExbD/TolR n=1 Tax=Mucilaginibacter litoreus TaxID=1048221 RepID=A0ABW3AW77_9SPHI